jgi:FdhD protein
MYHPGIVTMPIAIVDAGMASFEADELSVEEPLEIRLRFTQGTETITRPIAVTMRTPGADRELAAGFLITEGILRQRDDLNELGSPSSNVVVADLQAGVALDLDRLERQSYVSSSCGVCGKRSIAAVFSLLQRDIPRGRPRISAETISELAETQRAAQPNFRRTGGLHAAAWFDAAGQLLLLYEDVGRHNALDKLIGANWLAGNSMTEGILFLSGRASFELIQKAALAGIPIVAAVGAPSSLAVTLAQRAGMTLIGFVRENRFNVYADAGRLIETPAEWFSCQGIQRS